MIKVKNISKIYPGNIKAVDQVSFQVAKGQTLCLIGSSGSGKTTTLKVLNRLIEPSSGSIAIADEDVLEMDPVTLRRKMGYVIQRGGLFPHLTVAQNIGLLLKLEKWKPLKIQARVEELLNLVELPFADYAHRYPGELSGGQQQRVGVARALALNPPIMLLDEPFGALDPITREQVQDEFLNLQQKFQMTQVMVTHDMAEAFKFGDQIALMSEGKIMQLGKPLELLNHPANQFVAEFLKNHTGLDQVASIPVTKLLEHHVPFYTQDEISYLPRQTLQSYPLHELFVISPEETVLGYYRKVELLNEPEEARFYQKMPSLSTQDTIQDALSLLLKTRLSALPVLTSDNRLEGMLVRDEVRKLL